MVHILLGCVSKLHPGILGVDFTSAFNPLYCPRQGLLYEILDILNACKISTLIDNARKLMPQFHCYENKLTGLVSCPGQSIVLYFALVLCGNYILTEILDDYYIILILCLHTSCTIIYCVCECGLGVKPWLVRALQELRSGQTVIPLHMPRAGVLATRLAR